MIINEKKIRMEDYSYNIFEQQYARMVLLSVLAESKGLTEDNFRAYLDSKLNSDSIEDIMFRKSYQLLSATLKREVWSLHSVGFIGKDDKGFYTLTGEGMKALRSNYYNNQYANYYYSFKALEEQRKSVEQQAKSSEQAKKAANWAMVAAISAAAGVAIQVLILLIDRIGR